MTELNPLAVQNAPLLRALRDRPADGWGLSDLAEHIGRDASNTRRSVARLEDAGLAAFNALTHGLTPDGEAQLAAIARAEGQGADPRFPEQIADIRTLQHFEIVPDPANARRDWDSDEAKAELDALRQDILAHGLLQNLVVRLNPGEDAPDVFTATPQPATYMLVGGERRWRAIGLAIDEDDWPRDRPIPCRVVELDDLGHRLAALAENLQRRNLNPLEKALAFDGLAQALCDQGVPDDKINREIADRVGVTIEHVQQHRGFMRLDPADRDRLTLPKDDPRRLTVREARQKVTALANAPKPVEIAPEDRLIMAELVHAVAARATYTYADIRVGAQAVDEPRMAGLTGRGWVHFNPAVKTWGEDVGHFGLALGYQGEPAWKLFDWFASPDEAERDAGLAAEHALAGVTPTPGTYATTWLNPPFALTPEGQAAIDADAQVQAERQAQAAEQDRQRAAQQAEHQAELARQAQVAARSRDLFLAVRTAGPTLPLPRASLCDIAAQADAALPWRMNHRGDVVAADGEQIIGGAPSDRGEARMRLLILAVNAAAGLETPEDDPDPNPELDREAFIQAMASRLAELEPDWNAATILDEFLTENGVPFGAPEWDWTAAGAVELVDDHVANARNAEAADVIAAYTDQGDDADEDAPQQSEPAGVLH